MKNRRKVAPDSARNDRRAAHAYAIARAGELGEPQVEEFIASMPERYQDEFDWESAREHARIATARGERPIHVDLFSEQGGAGSGLCVVAPDGPGLLALISAGLMLEGFDITRADAYTRRVPPRPGHPGEDEDIREVREAVDLFWVRRSPPGSGVLGEADVSALRSTLRELLRSGMTARGGVLRRAQPASSDTSVQFREVRCAPWLTLKLESHDRPGLLAAVTAALASEGVQIVDSRIRTHGQRVYDYFDILESDGSRPSGTRLQRIELAVLRAIDGRSFDATPAGSDVHQR